MLEMGRPPVIGGLTFRANFRWTLTGNVVNAACQWGMISALAWLGSRRALGQFVLGLSIAAPVISFTMLQLRAVQVTDVRGEFSFGDYLGTRILWTLVAMATIIVASAWLVEDATTFWVVMLVGLMKCVDSLSDIVRGLFQSLERMDLTAVSLMMKGVPSLTALVVTMWLTQSIVKASAAMVIVWTASLMVNDLWPALRLRTEIVGAKAAARELYPRFRRSALVRLTLISLPLGVVMALISLQANIPRYFLQVYRGEEAVGYFGAIVYPMMAGMIVTAALGQSACTRLARSFAEDLPEFQRLLGRLTAFSAVLGLVIFVGTYLFGRPVLRMMYGPSFADYYSEFVVVALAFGIQLVSSCLGYGMTAARFFRGQVAITAGSCIVTAGAAVVLVPRFGIMGAAEAVLATSLIMALGFAVGVFHAVRVRRAATYTEGFKRAVQG